MRSDGRRALPGRVVLCCPMIPRVRSMPGRRPRSSPGSRGCALSPPSAERPPPRGSDSRRPARGTPMLTDTRNPPQSHPIQRADLVSTTPTTPDALRTSHHWTCAEPRRRQLMRITSSVWAAETMQHALMHRQHHCYEQNEQNNAHLYLLIRTQRCDRRGSLGVQSSVNSGRSTLLGLLVRPGPSNRATPQKAPELYGFLTSADLRERWW